ncbi:MAG: dihydroorotase [Duncaniella sp.]|nr:dihydroorotase [Duncaniella sp.]
MILLYNGLIINEGERFTGYVAIEGELISEVGHGQPSPEMIDSAEEAIDLNGDMVIPGVIDTHVHFRDPGLTEKGDIATESKAAVMGGVTSYIDMPNTLPPTVTRADVDDKIKRAREVSVANYGFFIGATNSNFNEIAQADYTRIAGVKLFMGSSTGNMLVDDTSAISKIFSKIKAPVAIHAEDEATIAACRASAEAEYAGKEVPVDMHPAIRSRHACYLATSRAVELARKCGTRLHVCHISTADELSLFSPGDVSSKLITAETGPHYLYFDSNDYSTHGARVKCNPAIKECSDKLALLRAVENRTIDTIATDHAPHQLSSKEGGALKAASGMPGIEFSLPVMLELADDNPALTEERIIETMCHNPAVIFRIDRRGFLRRGYYADITVVGNHRIKISDESVTSRCGWTPYAGLTVSRLPVMTIVNGCVVMRDRRLTGCRNALPLKFNN